MAGIGYCNYFASVSLLLLLVFSKILEAKLPDIVKCVDPKCEGKISSGLTTQTYMSREKGLLSFKPDAEVFIYSKGDGSNSALWGVEINGQKGFVPKRFVKELKVHVKDDKLIDIPTHLNDKVNTTLDASPDASDKVPNSDSKEQEATNDLDSEEIYSQHTPAGQVHLSTGADQEHSENSSSSDTDNQASPENAEEAKNIPSQEPNTSDIASNQGDDKENSTPNTEEVGKSEDIEQAEIEPPTEFQPTHTEIDSNSKFPPTSQLNLNPEATSKNFEIFEGTTLYTDPGGPDTPDPVPEDFPPTSGSLPVPFALRASQTIEGSDHVEQTDPLPSSFVDPQVEVGSPETDVINGTSEEPKEHPDFEESDVSAISLNSNSPETEDSLKNENVDLENGASQVPSDVEDSGNEDATDISNEEANDNPQTVMQDSKEPEEAEANDHLDPSQDEKFDFPFLNPGESKSEQEESFSAPKPDSIIHDPSIESTTLSSDSGASEASTENDFAFEVDSEVTESSLTHDQATLLSGEAEINSETVHIPESHQGTLDETADQKDYLTHQERIAQVLERTAQSDSVDSPDSELNDSPQPLLTEDSSISGDPVEDSKFDKDTLPFTDPEDSNGAETLEPASAQQEEKEQHANPLSSLAENFIEATSPLLSDGMSLALENELANPQLSSGSLTLLLIVAGTIIAIYFTHMVVKKMSQEAPLLEAMNNLARKFRLTHEENHALKKQLTNSNGQIKTQLSIESSEKIMELQNEVDRSKALHDDEKADLTQRIQQLEQDLEDAETNATELHQMLDELLSEKKEATNFQDSLDQVQAMLDAQRENVETLNSDLLLKKRLNEELQFELKANRERAVKYEHQIEQLTYSMEELNTSKHEALKSYEKEQSMASLLRKENLTLQENLHETEKEMKRMLAQVRQLRESENDLRRAVGAKEAELKVSKECLKKIQLSSKEGANKMRDLLNAVELKSQLAASQKENATLLEQLSRASDEYHTYEDSIGSLKGELKEALSKVKVLEHDKEEVKTKLEVLTNYFKEKESELTKELESKEGLRLEAEGSASVVANKIQNYESELSALRSQLETLKSELEDQKQSYKMLLINEEQKTQENWLSFRAAKRRQEELLQENSQLRQRLSSLQQEKADSQNALLKPMPKRLEANGSMSSPVSTEGDLERHHSSPPTLPLDMDGHLPPLPHMLPPMFPGGPPPPPLPPGLHHPPPPPPFLGGLPLPLPDRRLPPAGRIASPPFRRHRSPPGGYDRRSYSPSSDHSHYSDQYSPTMRYSPGGVQRSHSPDRRSDRSRHYNSRSHRGEESPPPGLDRHSSPDRWYNRSPDGGRHPKNYEDFSDFNRGRPTDRMGKGTKTSTPLGPNDR